MFCLAINSTNNATRNQKLASFGGLLLLGFISSYKKLTLISGGVLLSEFYKPLWAVFSLLHLSEPVCRDCCLSTTTSYNDFICCHSARI